MAFAHRREQWADRIQTNRAVAYRIHEDTIRGRWYLTASWTIPPVKTVPVATARTDGLVGVDTNADHLAAWRLDTHGNPVGEPLRFDYDLSGTAQHRDAQIRHALVRLLHFAKRHHLAIAVEDLDFTADKTREKHGRRKTFRHDAAAVAIGRRALGHPIRRRTAPPPAHRRDEQGIGPSRPGLGSRGVRNPAPAFPDHGHDPCAPNTERKRATRTPNTVRDVRLSMSPGTRTHSRSVFRNGQDSSSTGACAIFSSTLATYCSVRSLPMPRRLRTPWPFSCSSRASRMCSVPM